MPIFLAEISKKCLTNKILTYIIDAVSVFAEGVFRIGRLKILLISEVFTDEENLSAKEASKGKRTRFQKENGYCVRQKSFV